MPTPSVWTTNEFPKQDIDVHSGTAEAWFAAKYTLRKPYCWTPTKPFMFGGKEFLAGYPCVAHGGQNFGFIIQQCHDGVKIGKE